MPDVDALYAWAEGVQFDVTGVAITVTRPPPDDTPVASTGIWLGALRTEQPFGVDYGRRGPRRVFAIERTAGLTHVPKGSLVVAPEKLNATAKTWRVEGYPEEFESHKDFDEMRVILTPVV